jgi:hypothetical protein
MHNLIYLSRFKNAYLYYLYYFIMLRRFTKVAGTSFKIKRPYLFSEFKKF